MNATEITALFGQSVTEPRVEDLFSSLNTLRRPELPELDERIFHDWVLVRRRGVELGFADSEYHVAAPRNRWGRGKLLLTQAYFYSGSEDLKPFAGDLPYGLAFADSRDVVRAKLPAFEPRRRSHRTDCWDVDGYRLGVTYADDGQRIDRLACRVMPAPVARTASVDYPPLQCILDTFGTGVHEARFANLWGSALSGERIRQASEDTQIDLTEDFGATLGFAGEGKSARFRAITLHRNRDGESAGWAGELPGGLDFDDSPEMLFAKIGAQPVQHADTALTGHAVWHFGDSTLHVLYSNLDNRLLRIKLIAPGTWKCVDDA